MKKETKPIKIVTLDTETYGLTGDMKRIAIYDGYKTYLGYTFSDVYPILKNWSNDYRVHIYIHNLEFDLRKMPEIFDAKKIYWGKSFSINNSIVKLTHTDFVLHDSFALLPMALSKCSRDFGVEHGKLDLWSEIQKTYPNQYKNLDDFFNNVDRDDILYVRYLEYDVISLHEILHVLMDVAKIDEKTLVKCMTTSSLSRYIFKHGWGTKKFNGTGWNDYKLMIAHSWTESDKIVEQFIRASYYGGRTEVFTMHLDHKAYHLDVNSLYPYEMYIHEFPVGDYDWYESSADAERIFNDWVKYRDGAGFLYCEIYIPNQYVPPLPVGLEKLVFPCGHVDGVWTFPELEYAINECGCKIEKYGECCYFPETQPIFRDFVGTMYDLKENAGKNLALRTFAKLLMNCGYGYTGMKREKCKLVDFDNFNSGMFHDVVEIDMELNYMLINDIVSTEYIQPQIASYVTSYARLELLQALRYVHENGGNIYYCDTDSVVTDIPFPNEWLDSTAIGKWDLESQPLEGYFLKPKVYAERFVDSEILKFKGVSRDVQKTLHFDLYKQLYRKMLSGRHHYVVEHNRTMIRSIQFMIKRQTDWNYYEIRDKMFKYNTADKRVFDFRHNKSMPLYFENIDELTDFFKKSERIKL